MYLGRVARAAGDEARRLGLGEQLLRLFRAEVRPNGTPQLLVLLLKGRNALLERFQEELLAHPRPLRVLPIALPGRQKEKPKKRKNIAKAPVSSMFTTSLKYDTTQSQFWGEIVTTS